MFSLNILICFKSHWHKKINNYYLDGSVYSSISIWIGFITLISLSSWVTSFFLYASKL